MSMRRLVYPGGWIVFLSCSILLSWFPGFILAAVVTLKSIEIFQTHEWLPSEPIIYFKCKEENKIILPDVKKKNVLYTFKGEESWQPLTEFSNKKCKRCGVYEKDSIKSDDVFDEWELCPSDFTAPDGKNIHFKDKEFNATILCLDCVPLGSGSNHTSGSHSGGKPKQWTLVIIIIALVLTVLIIVSVATYKYWKKRKREQEQARFLKLFEDGDDIEDELGLGPLDGLH